jgi:hypothetical protein
MMRPVLSEIEPLVASRRHNLILRAGEPPRWLDHWVRNIPLIGDYLNLVMVIPQHTTALEDVADFLAEDLGTKNSEWMGKKMGMKQKDKGQ